MSLQTRLSALITAIGADIKQIKADLAAHTGNHPGGGSTGPSDKWVTSTQSVSTVAYASITELSGTVLPAGRYAIKAWLVWRSVAAATGAGFWVEVVGTTPTRNVGHIYTQTTGGAAATGINDQQTSGAVAQMIEGRAWRGADPGTFAGVDTAAADQLSIMEAILVLPAQGTLNILMKSEVAGSAVSIEPGSLLEFKAVG